MPCHLKVILNSVETLCRHLVDDALSALNWLSGKRERAPFCTQSDAGRLCGAGGYPGVFDAGRFVHRRCANFCRGLVQGLTGSRRQLTVVRDLPPQQPPSVYRSCRFPSMPREPVVCSLCCPTQRGLPQGARAHGERRDALCSGDVYRPGAAF